MSWEKELPISRGDVCIRPTEEQNVFSVEALVESGDEYLIWFQRLRCPDHQRQLEAFSVATKLRVAKPGTHPMCSLRLEPRILPVNGSQPASFLALAKRLLAPQQGEGWHGYLFTLSLELSPGSQVPAVVSDRLNEPHEGDFVEFMHMQDPLTLIAHREQRSFTSREIVELVLRLMRSWPLEVEANQ
jgi:hypothetical protein